MNLPKLPRKKTRVLAYEEELGKLKARIKIDSKAFGNQKQFKASLFNHIGKAIDRINPIKFFVIISLTFFIKTSIEWAEIPASRIMKTETLLKGAIATIAMGYVGGALALVGAKSDEEIKEMLDSPTVEVLQWLMSFIVAYLIVEHGAEIINAGGNLLGVAKGLIGGFLG